MCKNPYVSTAGALHGCGQCGPCRFNRRRVWMHRIMLEASQYEKNCFVTLTYDDDNLPIDGSLVPKHMQDWLKRLRGRVSPSTFRYFAVGEYGDSSERPHYHAALFGFPNCDYGVSRYNKYRVNCCHWCDLVRDSWGLGHIMLGTLENSSAGYIAGYVTKKMTGKDDVRLKGRHPEFARMSLRPGIGHDACWEIANVLMQHNLDVTELDVPSSLRHGKRELPLGRYLRVTLRNMIGKDKNAPQEIIDKIGEEVLPMRLAARSDEEKPSFKAHAVEASKGKVAGFEARQRIFKQRRVL